MRALYQRSAVDWRDVEQVTKTELSGEKAARHLELRQRNGRVQEQLHRVVAGLTVDIDGPGEVRRFCIVQPPIVAEPAVARGQRNEIAGTGMIQSHGSLAFLVE